MHEGSDVAGLISLEISLPRASRTSSERLALLKSLISKEHMYSGCRFLVLLPYKYNT